MLGPRLRQSRESLGFSRRDLSEASGVDQTTIYKIETGKIGNPNLSTLEDLASALKIDVFYLLDATDDPARKNMAQDRIKVMKTLSVEQVKKTLEEFKEISDRLKEAHKTRGSRIRPYYPLFIDSAVDKTEIPLDDVKSLSVKGHISIEYHEQIDYILPVAGDSMMPFAGNGSLIFVRRFEPHLVKDEDLALFLIREKKITLLRQVFYHRIDKIQNIGLRSFNPHETLWYPLSPDFILCQGKVVGSENDRKEIDILMGRVEKIR